ncbi:hypothetical protein [Pelosinus baikalensis]|uniref:Uncharacterized protein n=1 Tax=Pelosinus baikalensis TaxID=2892015 RepID=A0ABS8HNW4_9FIRM|nr:hypothetical protein [Pelosinus baikalensis]MCC5463832.1 hypothetical protein [Pelosinus baikalensis]
MGHIVNSEKEYRLLQQRLDRNIIGASYSPVFIFLAIEPIKSVFLKSIIAGAKKFV